MTEPLTTTDDSTTGMPDLRAEPGDGMVFLHGILLNQLFMLPLEKNMQNLGYRTLNITYPSSRLPIEAIARKIGPKVTRFASSLEGRIHFVGHSMGGLVTRALLKNHRPDNLGRVVMLGTPNHGSEVADWWKDKWIYQILFGPAGQQLITDQTELLPHLAMDGFELGVIAADCAWDPFNSRLFDGPNDGKVSVASTRLDGMKDHITLHVTHTLMTWNREVIRQTATFLKQGAFDLPQPLRR